MACVITLPEEEKHKLSYCMVIPKDPFMRKAPTPIEFKKESPDGRTFIVPFTFGNRVTKSFPNDSKNFRSLDLKFNIELKENQIPVVEEAMAQLDEFRSTTLYLCTSYGKTTISTYITSQLNLPTVVVVRTEELQRQWFNTLTDNISRTDGSPLSVVKVKKGVEEDEYRNADIIICMKQRWKKFSEDQERAKEIRKSIGLLIVDEAHEFCTPGSVGTFLCWQPKYVVLLTATPTKSNETHRMLWLVAGKHSVSKKLEDMIEESGKVFRALLVRSGIVPDLSELEDGDSKEMYRGMTIGNESVTNEDEVKGAQLFTKIVNCMAKNEERNNLIISIIETLYKKPDTSILVITARQKHAEDLDLLAKGKNLDSDYVSGIKNQFKNTRILFGTRNKIGTGFDQKSQFKGEDIIPFNYLILACSYKQNAPFEQSVGRIMRSNNPTVIYILDEHRYFQEHWKICKRWLESKGATVEDY